MSRSRQKKQNGSNFREGMQLLDMDSDSGDQVEHFALSGMATASMNNRKKEQCCLTREGACLLFLCCILFAAVFVLAIMHIRLQNNLVEIQESLNKTKLESGSQDNPEEFQGLHKKIQDLEKQLVDIQNGEDGLEKLVSDTDAKIGEINKKLEKLGKDLNDAKKTSPTNELDTIQQSLATLGSDVKTAQDDIKSLQLFKTDAIDRLNTLESNVDTNTPADDHSEDNEELNLIRDQLSRLENRFTSLDAVVSANISMCSQQSTQNQIQVQELWRNTTTLWQEIESLKLSTRNTAVPSTSRTPTTPSVIEDEPVAAQAVDQAVIEQLIQAYVNNISDVHSGDIQALQQGMQQQVSDLNARLDTLEKSGDPEVVSAETFLAFKNTVTVLHDRLRTDLNTSTVQVSEFDSLLQQYSDRLTLLEQEVHNSPTDGFITEGEEPVNNNNNGEPSNVDDAKTETGAGDGGGDDGVLGKDDGHLPEWLTLPPPTERGDIVTESPANDGDASDQGIQTLHNEAITSTGDVRQQFQWWDEDRDGYVTYEDIVAHLPGLAYEDDVRQYDLNADNKYDINEIMLAFGFPTVDPSYSDSNTNPTDIPNQ